MFDMNEEKVVTYTAAENMKLADSGCWTIQHHFTQML